MKHFVSVNDQNEVTATFATFRLFPSDEMLKDIPVSSIHEVSEASYHKYTGMLSRPGAIRWHGDWLPETDPTA